MATKTIRLGDGNTATVGDIVLNFNSGREMRIVKVSLKSFQAIDLKDEKYDPPMSFVPSKLFCFFAKVGA